MADTEAIIRTALRHLLDYPKLLKTFMSKERDNFLDDLIFANAASVREKLSSTD